MGIKTKEAKNTLEQYGVYDPDLEELLFFFNLVSSTNIPTDEKEWEIKKDFFKLLDKYLTQTLILDFNLEVIVSTKIAKEILNKKGLPNKSSDVSDFYDFISEKKAGSLFKQWKPKINFHELANKLPRSKYWLLV